MTREEIEKLLGEGASKETVSALLDAMHAEIKGHKDTSALAQAQLEEKTKELLSVTKGATDAKDLKDKLEALQLKYDADTKAAAQKVTDLEFSTLLEGAIRDNKGRSAKAIHALLDLDTLRASKNQKEDVAKAVKALAGDAEGAFLFGDTKPTGAWGEKLTGDPSDAGMASMREAMGLVDKSTNNTHNK